MKIDLKKKIVNLADTPITIGDTNDVLTLGIALSNILVSSKEGGKMKLYVLAQKFYKDKSIELDESDMNLVKNAVKASEAYNTLIVGQVELILSKTI